MKGGGGLNKQKNVNEPATGATVFLLTRWTPAAFSSPGFLPRITTEENSFPGVNFLLFVLREGLDVDLCRVETKRRVLTVVGQVLPPFLRRSRGIT